MKDYKAVLALLFVATSILYLSGGSSTGSNYSRHNADAAASNDTQITPETNNTPKSKTGDQTNDTSVIDTSFIERAKNMTFSAEEIYSGFQAESGPVTLSVMNKETEAFTDEEIKKIKTLFAQADTNKDDSLTMEEFRPLAGQFGEIVGLKLESVSAQSSKNDTQSDSASTSNSTEE